MKTITPINFIIPSAKSYWVVHFYSVLQCLDKHLNLKYSPRGFHGYPNWSMSQIRGDFPHDFFNGMLSYVRNWGFQYFLCNLFNQKVGPNVVGEIVYRLECIHNCDIRSRFDRFWFYVAGNDSELGSMFLSRFSVNTPEIFPLKSNNKDYLAKKFLHTAQSADICLVMTSSSTEERIAIFGEIEGNKGSLLRRQSYWNDQPELCVFAIGITPGNNKQLYFDDLSIEKTGKCLLLFETSHWVSRDFEATLNFFRHLLLFGPNDAGYHSAVLNDEEFKHFSESAIKHWSEPIPIFSHSWKILLM